MLQNVQAHAWRAHLSGSGEGFLNSSTASVAGERWSRRLHVACLPGVLVGVGAGSGYGVNELR